MNVNTNIVNKETTNKYAEMVLKTLKESLSLSLGPFGSTAILQGRQAGDDIMTKDGYSILKKIKFNDPIANTFLEMFRDASCELVEKVGDGSTTTIIAAYYIYESLKSVMDENNLRPRLILDKINNAVENIIYELNNIKKEIPSDDLTAIEKIANTSLNHNPEVSKLIREIYEEIGTEGFIKVKLGNTEKTYYTKTNGFQLENGYYDKIFINSDNAECVLKDTAVLLFDATVMKDEDINTIFDLIGGVNEACAKNKNNKYKSVLVIAPGYSDKFKNKLMLLNNKYVTAQVPFNYCIVQHSLNTEMNKEILFDLSMILGADIIKNSLDYKLDSANQEVFNYVGYCENITLTKKITTFVGKTEENTSKVEEIKSDIKNELKEMEDNHVLDYKRIYELNKRLAVINKNLVTLFVGGNSEQERKTNKHLIDDAVSACKSALQYGYVIGGNIAISLAVNNIFKKYESTSKLNYDIYKAISEAFINVYREVLDKSTLTDDEINEIIDKSIKEGTIFDLTSNSYTSTEVINSVRTEIEILKNVISIISLILTSNQFIEVNANSPIKGFDRDIYEV